ncbi:uncharacterized protein LOC111241416 [Vigna radiata var. radiata]|uniref:Uncharacterized protein LOC111241416 n=1 Tax=Vigna radiata var. radiata TaxID=3916 RepID=A0A3Q0ETQ3_VIGRR|nr:uncharacterized protein LOC111241416 [Vigna radiata var. radiata]
MNWWSSKRLHFITQIISTLFAVAASCTTDPSFKRHTVTRHQMFYLITNFFYDPSTLMTNYHWFLNYEVCNPQFLKMNITATDPNSFHSNSDIMGI